MTEMDFLFRKEVFQYITQIYYWGFLRRMLKLLRIMDMHSEIVSESIHWQCDSVRCSSHPFVDR